MQTPSASAGAHAAVLSVDNAHPAEDALSAGGQVGVGRPATARPLGAEERVQAALQAAELDRNRLMKVLEVLPVGVAIADSKGKVQLFNDALRRIWGGPPDATRHRFVRRMARPLR
jgi:PAS domain-containing protein